MTDARALEQLLEDRARALAAPRARVDDEQDRLTVLVLALAGERYALETRWLHAVVPRARWTPLPGAPPALLGVTAFRGDPLPVFDLRALLGLAGEAGGRAVVVMGAREPELGLAADEVEGVASIARGELRASPPGAAALARVPTLGVREDGVAVLEAGALLRDPRLVIDDPAAPDAEARGTDERRRTAPW